MCFGQNLLNSSCQFWTIQLLFKFCIFFIVITHNSPVNFKLIHFLLGIKVPHKSSKFWVPTFKCSGKNLPNSSCYFPNHKSILHHSLMSWKITPLYSFRSNITYLSRKGPKYKFLRLLCSWIKIHQILVSFETRISFSSNFASIFNVMRHNSSVPFSWNFICFQQKEPIQVQIWWNRKSEIWHFDGVPLSK